MYIFPYIIMLLITLLFIVILGLLVFQLYDIKKRMGVFELSGELKQRLLDTQQKVSAIKDVYEARKVIEDESQRILRKLETIMTGSRSKGTAGENILAEALSVFPPGMVVHNFKLGSKSVEFALVFPHNHKVLPIDSKWPATEELLLLENEKDEINRQRIVDKIQVAVDKKVKEVAQYIDPNVTLPWAIAAVPDAIFELCRGAHYQAAKQGVFLVSYSLSIPYLLTFYELQLKYAKSIDIENLEGYIMSVQSALDRMEDELNHKLSPGIVRIENAYNALRDNICRIRSATITLQNAPSKRETGETSDVVYKGAE